MRNPTYEAIQDHTESVRVEYDPEIVSYECLVYKFYKLHTPTVEPRSRQYRSAIFYSGPEQKEVAQKFTRRLEKKMGTILTDIEPLNDYYLAEEYHQQVVI